MKHRHLLVLSVAVLLLVSGCATPVGVTPADLQTTYRTLTSSVLSTGKLSAATEQYLRRHGLAERFESDPEAVLNELRGSGTGLGRPTQFALAELSFAYAERSGRREFYLAAAVYAYAVLLSDDRERQVADFDPQPRLAGDLYNLGLMLGLAAPDGGELSLAQGNRPLPFGQLDLTVEDATFFWGGYRFTRFVPVAQFQVRGLRNRYRQPGLGVALAAELTADDKGPTEARAWIPPGIKVPVTAFLRIEDVEEGIASGRVRGRIELYPADETKSVEVGGRKLPLEQEPTATLAYMLEGAPVWGLEISAFLSADVQMFGDGLIMLHPYQAGRIPVVLIHGTASSPARWAEMLNELENDPILHDRIQFWLFMYNTSNPILFSAKRLRDALTNAVNALDPGNRDSPLHRMVLIGHSQGGLLARLMVTDSGPRFWNILSRVPLSELRMSQETRELLQSGFFFEPLPFISQVIFVATPHQGSFRAAGVVRNLVRRIVRLPITLFEDLADAARQNPDVLTSHAEEGLKSPRTAVDNMSPGSPFIRTLSASPIAPSVEVHSIVPVLGKGPLTQQTDGVVRYESAHLDVGTEKVVYSGHSTLSTPATIEEVRRILLEQVQGK